MFAVIHTGGKQYRVTPEMIVRVEKLEGEPGSVHVFDQVLALQGEDGALKIGAPTVGGYVVGQVRAQGRGKKVYVIKFKRRKSYRRKKGHRQPFTELVIKAFGLGEAPADLVEKLAAEGIVEESEIEEIDEEYAEEIEADEDELGDDDDGADDEDDDGADDDDGDNKDNR